MFIECSAGALVTIGDESNLPIEFPRRLLEAGLWTRVHAYHEGHRTILTKLGLLADDTAVDFVLDSFRKLVKREGCKANHWQKET